MTSIDEIIDNFSFLDDWDDRSVSYTHLDVYKRQKGLSWLAFYEAEQTGRTHRLCRLTALTAIFRRTLPRRVHGVEITV